MDEKTHNKNIIFSEQFGFSVYGKTLGEAWINTVECVLKNGASEPDENRDRLALQNFRIKSETQILPDGVFEKFAKKENINAMIDLVFNSEVMKDFDVIPSFRVGAKSYKTRLEEGKMLDFIIDRLVKIPESKKAVMVFPTYEDYAQISKNHFDDYLPCIVSIQFRLRPFENGSHKLNTIFNMRSWNIDQKGAGDLTVFAMLNHKIASALSERLNVRVEPGSIDGLITDVHIYNETKQNAEKVVTEYHTS